MFSRSSRPVAIAVLFVLVALASTPTALAQAAPNSLALVMTNTPWVPGESNSTATLDEGPAFHLVAGGSGATFDPGCASVTPGGGQAVAMKYFWVTPNATSPFPITPVGNLSIPLTFNAVSPRPAPATLGTVTISAVFGFINPGENFHPHDAWVASASFAFNPTSAATSMPGSTTLDIPFEQNPFLIGGNALQFLSISVSCAGGPAYFTITTGSVEFKHVIGNPGDVDTDGDGVPDPYDDDDDGDGFADAVEQNAGSSPTDGTITPQSDSTICSGYTYEEVVEDTGDPNKCPKDEGIDWLLILLVLVALIVLGAAGYGGLMMVNRGIKMTVSHDGFQSIEKGETAKFGLTVQSASKKDVEIPVLMELKGVPEDWTATLSPDQLRLHGGEAAEPTIVALTVIPPPGSEYEDEAQITVTATPTDEEGKTSALKPGTSVKTKTIVNIGITPPEGESKKKKAKKAKAEVEEGAAEEAEPKKKRFGRKAKEEAPEADAATAETAPEEGKKSKFGGLLKRKPKAEEAPAADEDLVATPATVTEAAAAAAAAPVAAAAASGGAKPQLAMGKMVHVPESFSAGDEVTTTVPVSNKGDGPVENLRLSLFVNDERVAHENLDLSPGEKREVVFKWTARPDENRVRVKGDIIKK